MDFSYFPFDLALVFYWQTLLHFKIIQNNCSITFHRLLNNLQASLALYIDFYHNKNIQNLLVQANTSDKYLLDIHNNLSLWNRCYGN